MEARKLPPFTKSPEEPRARPAVRTVTLGDGADVLLWNGGAFEQTHRGLPVIGRGATVALDPRGVAKVSVVRLEEDLPASIVPWVASSARPVLS